jgi:small redox-active disulfide protein 2
MVIKILGTGCPRCKTLFQTVEKAVAELGIDAEVIKEEDLTNIMNYNVMSLPALVVDEKVVAKGAMNLSEVKEVLTKIKENQK